MLILPTARTTFLQCNNFGFDCSFSFSFSFKRRLRCRSSPSTTNMSFNATTVAAAAAAHASQLSSQSLYANIDLTKLSWLEQMWAAWYIWIDNPIIATGLMSFLLHEVIPSLLAFRDVSLSSLFRLCTSDVLSLGLLSTLFHISVGGSFSLIRSPLLKSSGSARRWFYSRISPSSFQL